MKKQISSSTAGGRWDQMVLRKKAETGDPHTCQFVDMWNGWGSTIRTISQINRNATLHFEKDYSSRSIIDLPPPI